MSEPARGPRRRAARLLLTVLALLGAGCGGAAQPAAPVTVQFAPAHPVATYALHDPRFGATATLLHNGQVLTVGGVAAENTFSSTAELYDPATRGFNLTGGLLTGRAYHSATLLADGRVLITGGLGGDGQPIRGAELYDPGTGRFSAIGNLIEARYDHTATLLPNGKVLIAGGDTANTVVANLDTAELYDPATGSFSPTGKVTRYYDPDRDQFFFLGRMLAARGKHTATRLNDGNVLLVGGGDTKGTAQASAAIYVTASGQFLSTGNLNVPRTEHRATLLGNGDVLVSGGVNAAGQALATAEIYQAASGKFLLTTAAFPTGTPMHDARYEHTATALADGRVLIAGGGGAEPALATAELYDPARGAFACVGGRQARGNQAAGDGCPPSMSDPRDLAVAVALKDGEVVIMGGYNPRSQELMMIGSVDLYDPSANAFIAPPRPAS